MSNWIDYDLDVLASNPTEINQIAERLKRPSVKLISWVARRFDQPVSEIAANLRELVEFKAIQNIGYLHESVNKARSFRNSFQRWTGIVDSHLYEISEEFPSAIFLLEYCDMQASYSGKTVIRAGEVVQHIHDGAQKAQAHDWALLDIFAPFRAEHELGLQFGSLWNQWVDDVIAAAQALKKPPATDAPPERQARTAPKHASHKADGDSKRVRGVRQPTARTARRAAAAGPRSSGARCCKRMNQ